MTNGTAVVLRPEGVNCCSAVNSETGRGQGMHVGTISPGPSCLHNMGHTSLHISDVTKPVEIFFFFFLAKLQL